MKKIFLFLLLAGASTSTAFAQARAGGNMSSKDYTGGGTTQSRNTGFGVKGGYNFNALRGDDIKNGSTTLKRDAHNDFHAGAYGQFGLNEFSSVQAELLYSRQGFAANTGGGGGSETYRMDYFSVPIMYVGNLTENISLHVGPQLSLLMNASRGGTTLDLAGNGFHSLDYGGVAGGEIRIGPARVGARYNLSLGPLFKEPTLASSQTINAAGNFKDAKVYNNLFQLYVGIGFTQ